MPEEPVVQSRHAVRAMQYEPCNGVNMRHNPVTPRLNARRRERYTCRDFRVFHSIQMYAFLIFMITF